MSVIVSFAWAPRRWMRTTRRSYATRSNEAAAKVIAKLQFQTQARSEPPIDPPAYVKQTAPVEDLKHCGIPSGQKRIDRTEGARHMEISIHGGCADEGAGVLAHPQGAQFRSQADATGKYSFPTHRRLESGVVRSINGYNGRSYQKIPVRVALRP